MRLVDADLFKKDLQDGADRHEYGWDSYDKGAYQAYTDAIELLDEQPSAEPEKVLIARINLSEEQVREAVERAKNEIVQVLSSVEQEIIRCGNCKYYNTEERLCNDLMGFGRYWSENDFCSFAERRTDG